MQSLLRLALSGLLLERPIFREQRDAPDGLRRGLLLVLLVGLLVGIAALVGGVGSALINPSPMAAAQVIYERLGQTAWLSAQDPRAQTLIDTDLLANLIGLIVPGVTGGLIGLVAAPLLGLLAWLIYGLFAHLMARVLGGRASLKQTLACTALASGAQLLSLGQIFPIALLVIFVGQTPSTLALGQGGAASLLGLIGNYIALREAHELPPWRAFWAAILGPALLLLLSVCGYCALVFTLASAL